MIFQFFKNKFEKYHLGQPKKECQPACSSSSPQRDMSAASHCQPSAQTMMSCLLGRRRPCGHRRQRALSSHTDPRRELKWGLKGGWAVRESEGPAASGHSSKVTFYCVEVRLLGALQTYLGSGRGRRKASPIIPWANCSASLSPSILLCDSGIVSSLWSLPGWRG